jgi:hypothetical protein
MLARKFGGTSEHCDMEGHPSLLDVVSMEGVQREKHLRDVNKMLLS